MAPDLHRRRNRPWLALAAAGTSLAALALALALGLGANAGGGEAPPPAARSGPMGGPVVDVGGQASGEASAGGVVVEGARWELGRVPLMVTVEPSWTLRNASGQTVSLGQPHADVLDGCCPGPLALGTTTLAPGGSTTVTFPLQMHPGMDGPHAFDVHVPVTAGPDTEILTLGVVGDFRD